jgi:hypothetical protein
MGSRERRRRVRGEAADAQVREGLEPLAPGERPRAVAVGAAVALVIALANPVLYAAGYEVRGAKPSLAGVAVLSILMLWCAASMWRSRYWAVLGFQALLALTCIFSGLSLLVASNVEGGIRSGVVLVAASTLFWFLVRAMARIQMPRRPDSVRRHG